MASFSDRLKELRKGKGVTQKNMAEFLNMTERGFRGYEMGISTPSYDTLMKLADYFDVSLDYLTGRTNYSLDDEGHITVKVTPDIFSDEDKKKLIKD